MDRSARSVSQGVSTQVEPFGNKFRGTVTHAAFTVSGNELRGSINLGTHCGNQPVKFKPCE
jgi:hypothetical protein